MKSVPQRLSAAWTFVVINYLYCDVVGLMDSRLLRQYLNGQVDAVSVTPGFLLAASVLMELPIAMVLVSRVAGYRVNRRANLLAAMVTTVVQAASLFAGSPTAYYVFFSAVEITGTVAIGYVAWRWRIPRPAARDAAEPVPGDAAEPAALRG